MTFKVQIAPLFVLFMSVLLISAGSVLAQTPPATGTLTIIKEVSGGSATADQFTLQYTNKSTGITTTVASGAPTVLPLGSYTISETGGPAGYFQSPFGLSTHCVNVGGARGGAGAVPNTIELDLIDSGVISTCTITNVAQSDLSVSKSVDSANPSVGQTIVYTVTATNAGPATTTSNVMVHDVLPSGVTYVSDDSSDTYSSTTGDWTISSIALGTPAVLHITATVNAGTEGTTIQNTATVSASDSVVTDYTPDNNTGSASLTVNTPTPPPPPPTSHRGGGGGGGGSGCATGFVFNPSTLKCDPKGEVLGVATSTPQVLGVTCGLYMDQHLKKDGPKNNPDQVTRLQAFLNKHGFGSFTPTGYFGALTLAAVNAFQSKYANEILKPWNISGPTGLVYLTTIREINLIECPDLMIPVPTLIPWNQNPNAQ